MVLIKKIGAMWAMLLTTRPSKRISGTSLKSEFKRTRLAIWRVAGSPPPLQSNNPPHEGQDIIDSVPCQAVVCLLFSAFE